MTAAFLPSKGKPPVAYCQRAEESVVGFILYEPWIFPKVRKHLAPDDFFSPGARNIFRVLCDLDPITLEAVCYAIEKPDFFALSDALSHCAMTRILFYCDLGVVLRDAAKRREVAL